MASSRISLWVDCDPGHDDAFALPLAACHPELHLLGVSTVCGNASVEQTTANALGVLAAINRSEIPVYMGAGTPLARSRQGAEQLEWSRGTARLPWRSHNDAQRSDDTFREIRDALLSQPKGSPWLVAIGPLTNIARLMQQYPEVAEWIHGLSIMGGALGGSYTQAILGKHGDMGDVVTFPNRWAEFNFWCDPEAASIVFGNYVLASKTTLVTLDLSHQVLATETAESVIFSRRSEQILSNLLFDDLLRHNASTYRASFPNLPGPPLHDPIAVALVQPHLRNEGKGERWNLEVVLHGEELGRTIGTQAEDGEGIWIPKKIAEDAVWDMLAHSLISAESETLGETF